MVDGRTTDGRTDDDGRRLDGYTISSPCEPNGSGELTSGSLKYFYGVPITYEPCHEKTGFLHMRKLKTQISCAVTAQLIGAFVFAIRIVQGVPEKMKPIFNALYL